ncbi:MAG: flippase [Candidatus Magnetomorum sp.]|nr:flippase [Candidatus Magnetomorum sp.]
MDNREKALKQTFHLSAWLKADDTKRLVSNFFSLAVLQGVNYILPFVTLPYLIRVLGAEYFGLIAFANAMITYLLIVTDYGFNLTATRDISIYRNDNKKIIEIFSAVMIIKIALMSACFLLLCILVMSFEKFSENSCIYFFTFGTVIGQVLFPVWFFQGMERMKYITYLNILARSFFTVAIFICVKDRDDFYIVPILSSLGFLVAGLLSLLIVKIKFNIRFEWQSRQMILSYLKKSWNVFIIDFMPNLYNNFSTFLLGFVASMEMVGYYSLATKIIDIFNNFIYVVRNATYPYLNKNFEQFSIISQMTLLTGISFSIAIVCLSNSLFYIIFGDMIQKSLLYVYILVLSPFFLSVSVVFGSNKLLVLKKDQEMKNITILFSLFGFIMAISLIPLYGAVGAATTVILTRGFMAYLTYNTAKKII